MRDARNILEVEALGIDWMGFIFWPTSKRYVVQRPAYLPTSCQRVGVFVDATAEDILLHIADFSLDIIQLHGSESPDFISRLKNSFATPLPCRGGIGSGVSIIKAFNIATADDLEATKPYEGTIDYFLFDTRATVPTGSPAGSALPGGTGQQFDWSVLADYDGTTPFLLSGGIGPDDAERVRAFHHPKCIGIDLNSRFEVSPALKDVNKLKSFIKQL